MSTKRFLIVIILFLFVILPVTAQFEFNDGEQKFKFSGEITGMFTIGLAENEQAIIINTPPFPPGVYDDDVNGKNGYYTYVNFNFLYNPLPFIDVYAKFLTRHRPGSPYIPLQLENAEADTFNIFIDNAYGRLNAVKGLGLDSDLDVFFKIGKFDTTPSSFQRVSRYGAEDVMSKLRTKNIYALQLSAAYKLSFADSIFFSATTNQKLNEAITPLYDEDGTKGNHGTPSLEEKYDIPLHFALEIHDITTPFGPVSAELIYAYNAENIFSGSSFGFDIGMNIKLPRMNDFVFPVGFGAAIYEKNIDTFANTGLDTTNQNFLTVLHANDANTISFRRALRIGAGFGIYANPVDSVETQLNIGYSYSQVAHIYRDTLVINSFSVDLLAVYNNNFFVGGGLYLGTINEVEWKTSIGTDISFENGYSHFFRLNENLGYEVFGGILFGKSRIVFGYNCNRGLALNNSLESIPEAQIKYRQKDTGISEGLFERGGIFAKVVVSW